MKKKYYIHRSLGFVEDYFGHIGPKVKVSCFRYWIMRILGYRTSTESYNDQDPNVIYEGRHVINAGQDIK
jgi:hypothetical protein